MTQPYNPTQAYVASGALFLNARGEVLLVEPTYKEQRDIPGGMVEPGETPRRACVREVEEELALTLEVGRLLVVDSQIYPTGEDVLLFIFDGGVLDERKLSQIRLDESEINSIIWVSANDLAAYVPQEFATRLQAALEARATRDSYDLARGVRVGQGTESQP